MPAHQEEQMNDDAMKIMKGGYELRTKLRDGVTIATAHEHRFGTKKGQCNGLTYDEAITGLLCELRAASLLS